MGPRRLRQDPLTTFAEPRALLAPPPVTGGVDVAVPGVEVQLAATRWAGPGLSVLLLHGLASTRRFWDLVVPALAGAGLDVVTLDQRGHGDSERPSGPYDSGTVVADAVSALDALAVERCVVVGHSWGASTALRLAAALGARVPAVVAIDGGLGSARSAGPDRATARERLTPPRTALPPDRLRSVISGGPLGPWWSEALADAMLPLFGVDDDGLARPRLPFAAHMAIVDDLLDAAPPDLSAISCPAWLVSCEGSVQDDRARARSEALGAAGASLAQPRLHRWSGALHDVPLQWPALVAGLIRAAVEESDQLAPRRDGGER